MKRLAKLFAFLFTLWFLFLTCHEKKENAKEENNEPVYHKAKWDDGSIKAEGYYVNDTIKEGIFKSYYRGGKLESQGMYHDNKREGLWIRYFENGKQQFVCQYKNGIRSGTGTEFNESGSTKTCQVYMAYHRKGESGFDIDYFEDGSIRQVSGAPVVDLLANKDTLEIGDTLRISFQGSLLRIAKVDFCFTKMSPRK